MYYYNSVANLEASKVGILGWAKREKWMHYFMRRPRICSGDPSKRKSATAPYGTTTSTAMIEHGLTFQMKIKVSSIWLLLVKWLK